MAFVGLLALGLFVGCVAVLGFKQAQNDFAKGGTAILAATLGGVAVIFLDKLRLVVGINAECIFMYPIGLLIAVPWFYMPDVLKLGDEMGPDKQYKGPLIMWLAITGTIVVTALGVCVAFVPEFRRWLDR